MAALSCVREPATDSGICPGREPEAVADDGSVVSGWIRIKLQEDAAPLKVGVFTRGEADSGNPELDRAPLRSVPPKYGAVSATAAGLPNAAAGMGFICGTTSVSMRMCPCLVPRTASRRFPA